MSDYYYVVVTNSARLDARVCDYLHCAHAPAPDGAASRLHFKVILAHIKVVQAATKGPAGPL